MSWITGRENLSMGDHHCDDNFVWSVQSKLLCETDPVNMIPTSVFVIRWVAIVFGLPIHILVAAVILRTRQLHNPRNTFWLGAIACHAATLLMGLYEILTTVNRRTSKDDVFCRIYSLLVGFPYTSLLVSLLLATADRWIAISHPLYHRKHITVLKVILCLVTSWILVLFALTSPYWSGKVQLPVCSVHPDVMVWVTLSHFAIVVLIIVTQVLVYLRARQYFKFKAHHPNLKVDNNQSGSSASSLKPDEYFVHLPDKTISRLELEASVTLWCGVAMLFFFSLPLVFLFLAVFVCRATDQMNCDDIVVMIPYSRELLLWHSVISPLLYVLRSREFSGALRRVFPCCCSWLRKRDQPGPVPHL